MLTNEMRGVKFFLVSGVFPDNERHADTDKQAKKQHGVGDRQIEFDQDGIDPKHG